MSESASEYVLRYAETLASRLCIAARRRAKKRGLPCTIRPTDLVIPERCPVLGVPLKLTAGPVTPHSATLDRIVPELGYVPGNVAVISARANALKSDAAEWELRALHEYVASTRGQTLASRERQAAAVEPVPQVVSRLRTCADCGRPLAQIKQQRRPDGRPKGWSVASSPLCRSCGMRAAWQSSEYREAIRASRMRRRKLCQLCGFDGVSRNGRFHPWCWDNRAEPQARSEARRMRELKLIEMIVYSSTKPGSTIRDRFKAGGPRSYNPGGIARFTALTRPD